MLPLRPHPSIRPHGREAALTLVETVVAGMVVLIIGVALTTLLTSTVRTEARTSLHERKLAAAEGVFEQLKADNAWAGANGAGCNKMPMPDDNHQVSCDNQWLRERFMGANAQDSAARLVDQSGGDQAVEFEVAFNVKGIDDSADGVDDKDIDGTRPDYYAAEVKVRQDRPHLDDANPAHDARQDRWVVLNGKIDPPGRARTGSITISICKLARQWDERIPISGCPEADRFPLGFAAGNMQSGDAHAAVDWGVWRNRVHQSAGDAGWKMVTYDVRPAADVNIFMERVDDNRRVLVHENANSLPTGCMLMQSGRELHCQVTSGEITVSGLRPGKYSVQIQHGIDGYELSHLHSIPASYYALVESKKPSRVLQVLRPKTQTPQYDVSLWNCDRTYEEGWGGGVCKNESKWGVSGYLVPAPSSRARWSKKASVGAGAPKITFTGLAAGIHSPRIVFESQSFVGLTQGNAPNGPALPYIWLDPEKDGLSGGDAPNSGQLSYTQNWCDYGKRVAWLSGSWGLGPNGGTVEHENHSYTTGTPPNTTTHYYDETHYLYSATDYCLSSGGGGAAPGGGSGGA